MTEEKQEKDPQPTPKDDPAKPKVDAKQPFRVQQTTYTKDTSEKTTSTLSKAELIYALAGLLVGLILAVIGSVLILLDATGSVDWSFEVPGVKGELQTFALGVVFLVAGVIVIVTTRYSMKSDDTPKESNENQKDGGEG